MFSEKTLNLEEQELREQVRRLPAERQKHYHALESHALKDHRRYRLLNLLFFTGLNHFYLERWLRGGVNLALSLTAIYLLVSRYSPLYGGLMLGGLLIIEIPQMINSRHLVHSCNNRIMYRCLRKAAMDSR